MFIMLPLFTAKPFRQYSVFDTSSRAHTNTYTHIISQQYLSVSVFEICLSILPTVLACVYDFNHLANGAVFYAF